MHMEVIDTLKRDVASDLMAADDSDEEKNYRCGYCEKPLAESGFDDLAESILNMLKQRVIGDYMHTAAILVRIFQVMSE